MMPIRPLLVMILFLQWPQWNACAATDAASIRVTITDASGAVVANAIVQAEQVRGKKYSATVNADQTYSFSNLPAGAYSLTANAEGFATFKSQEIQVRAGQIVLLNIALSIAVEKQQVIVSGQGEDLDLAPGSNGSRLVVEGSDLDAFSDDPTELQSELMGVAGPAPGSDAGEIFVDGFSGATLPAKSAIRSVAINQDPFSARFDRVGYGRIEIFTKPGSDHLHGSGSITGNDSAFNSRNPFVSTEPSYYSLLGDANLTGPITRDSAYFVNAQHASVENNAVVSAMILDASFTEVPFSTTLPNTAANEATSGRYDCQPRRDDTLGIRYSFSHSQTANAGVGQFSLPSQASNIQSNSNTVQISYTQVLNPKLIHQAHIQFMRNNGGQTVASSSPTIAVSGAFTGGGNSAGNSGQNRNFIQLQDNISSVTTKASIQLGGQLRVLHESSLSEPDFNGAFQFSSLDAYRITQLELSQGMSPDQIRAHGGGASQFSLGAGNTGASVTLLDYALYSQADWSARKNFTLGFGIRFESQEHIHDNANVAPRLSIAWSPGRAATTKTVIRAGYGWFYSRFAANYVLQTIRQNGTNQQQYVVPLPDFYPTVPSPQTLGTELPTTVYRIGPSLRAPSLQQTTVSIDRQFGRSSTLSLSYVNTRGIHQLLSRNINAPLPGTYNTSDPSSGLRPLGNGVSIYEYDSEGVFRQNQLILNFRTRLSSKINFFGYYSLNDARADTAGAGSFPSNQYDVALDFGRAAYDIRHRIFVGGVVNLPMGIQLSPLVTASSGAPFNIVVGEDLNGDGQFNDRPAFATDLSRPSVIRTPIGIFDQLPMAGQTIIPINYGHGPSQFMANLRLTKSFNFGSRGSEKASEHYESMRKDQRSDLRYHAYLDLSVHNIFNHVNLSAPVSALGSPLFGKSNATSGPQSANRIVNLQLRFAF